MARPTQEYPEYNTEAGAAALAEIIRRYWSQRGYNVATKVVATWSSSKTGNVALYGVRSDTVRGWPRRSKR